MPMQSSYDDKSLYYKLLGSWLADCDGMHNCAPQSSFWPTRVIDVRSGDEDLTVVRILETQSRPGDQYVALSHCWGKPTDEEKKRYCTTPENYQQRLKGFSIYDLPGTFQDAIEIVRALGLRFLWIDAICIVQEDENDWYEESAKMKDVFSSAYCTIAVDSAKSWTDGFRVRKSQPQFSTSIKDGEPVYLCNTTHDFENDVISGELNQRAWVLQERVLSSRILHFAEHHTYFACGKNVRCENFTLLKSPFGKEYFILDPQFPDRLTRSGYRRTLEFIQDMFERYARAGLSYRKDKERAISGLLQQIRTTIDSECVHGTFSCFLSRLLLWRVLKPNNDILFGTDEEISNGGVSKYELPSWSWLSHDHITFLPEGRIKVSKKAISFGSEQQLNARIFTLEGCHMEEKDMGERHMLRDDDDQEIGEIWFDGHAGVPIGACVVLGRDEKPSGAQDFQKHWYVLLVSATCGNKYRRDGVGRIKPQYVLGTSLEGVLV